MLKKKLKHVDFREMVALLFDKPEIRDAKRKDLTDKYFREDSDGLIRRWVDSGMTDEGIYTDPRYLSEMMICYDVATKSSVTGFMKFIIDKKQREHKSWRDLTIFEDYNGAGLATVDMMLNGFRNIWFFNDVPYEVECFQKLCDHYEVEMPTNDLKREGSYDVVISLEIAEHFKSPVPYVEKIVDMVAPNGYLVYGSCFHGKNIYAGHFREYWIPMPEEDREGWKDDLVDGLKAARATKKIINDKFDLVFKGFNGKPQIYKRKANV